MRKISSCLIILLVFAYAQVAFAHVFKTDGTITVLLHSNPDDDPIAGQPNALLFGITDTTEKFDAKNCLCVVSISRNGKTLLETSLLQFASAPSLYSLTIPFEFPERGVYSIDVIGKPKIENNFQTFRTHFDLRVSRMAGESTSTEQTSAITTTEIIIATITILIISGLGIWYWRKQVKN